MRAADGHKESNVAATSAVFKLQGGLYDFAAVATWGGGSAKLQMLAPNGSTWLDVGSSTNLTTDGHATASLPAGDYKITIATATAVYAAVSRIPGE